jgi:hypothetical protein
LERATRLRGRKLRESLPTNQKRRKALLYMKATKECRAFERLLNKMPVKVIQTDAGINIRPLKPSYVKDGITYNEQRAIHWSDKNCIKPAIRFIMKRWDHDVYAEFTKGLIKLMPEIAKQLNRVTG